MVTVQRWTGAETKALRQAMRLSIRAFAAYLGIDARTINKWEARRGTITLRPHTQELMDTALQRAPEDVKTRFTHTVRSAQQEQHGNAAQLAAPEHDPALTPLSGDDGTDSLFAEERPEGSQSHRGDAVAQPPSLVQFGPVSDVAAFFAASLELLAAVTNGVNTGEGYNELLTSLRRWVDRMNRRDLAQLFGLTAITPFTASWLEGLNPDEQERMAAAIVAAERVDAQVVTHIESVLFDSFVSNDKLGPRAALHTVLAQQWILQAMITECPDELRRRLLSVFGNSLRLAGWIFFNAGNLSATRRYYERARGVAQEAQDGELATIVLGNLSHAAESSGKPAMAVDYAVAAETWAVQAHNPCLSSFASDIAACAFAAMGDCDATMQRLEGTQTYLPGCSEQPPSTPFYRYSDALHVARRGQCFLELGRTADAVQAIGESLNLYAGQVAKLPSSPNGINVAMAKLDLSTAHVQASDIDEGAAVLADVGDFVSQNRADRLVKRVRGIRATLEPWQDTAAVKQLDDHLYGSGLRS